MKLAEENGAVGVIIYNDPQENVDLVRHKAEYNDTFPYSWYLPPSGVERGSVMEFSGDPATEGFPSKGIRPPPAQPRSRGQSQSVNVME